MKKLLIVCYDFPPVGGVPVQRVIKFAKYLREFDVTPIVFTNAHGLGHSIDESLLELDYVKQTKVIRYGGTNLVKFHKLRHQQRLPSHPHYYYLGLKSILFMDHYSAWYFEVKREILRIAQEEDIDCVFTTAPPHSTHLLGKYLKDKLGIPWIMDMRDAMVQHVDSKEPAFVTFLKKKVEMPYEKRFCNNADAVITVSQPMLDAMIKRCPILKGKSSVITNGFDEEDFNHLPSYEKEVSDKLVVAYTGTLQGTQTPQYFFEGLSILVKSKRINPDDLLLRFVGYIEDGYKKIAESLIKVMTIEFLGFKNHKQALSYQLKTDVLLLVTAPNTGIGADAVMTGKVFEYLRAGHPIFALAPDGPLKNLIEDGRFGVVVPPNDSKAVADGFEKIYLEWKNNNGKLSYHPDITIMDRYNRKHLTQQLAEIVEQVTQKS
ncbi:MAG: glycosyltransferase family 4 protein [Candidatus Parabeggiatoa sp.]|nr:glycosyltransferase family 4 protein [Candidatus Parabeggiatoa sp.]